jgi:hypothetical protein
VTKRKRLTQKRLNEWINWSLRQLQYRRIDPFLQGWRCAFAIIMAFEGIPADVRKEICESMSKAESVLWKKTRKQDF